MFVVTQLLLCWGITSLQPNHRAVLIPLCVVQKNKPNNLLTLFRWWACWKSGPTSQPFTPWSCWTTVFLTQRSARSPSDASENSGTQTFFVQFAAPVSVSWQSSVWTFNDVKICCVFLHTVMMNFYSTSSSWSRSWSTSPTWTVTSPPSCSREHCPTGE